MTDLQSFHKDHGAVFEELAGRTVVTEYHRPERTHQAVRNGVGVIEHPYGVLVIDGADRVEYVNNIVTNQVPRTDGMGTYAFLLSPQGRILSDMYIYRATDRLLVFTPPGNASMIADEWEVFIEDVSITVASSEYTVFGVHGPNATEKIASVFTGDGAPEERLTFDRGSMDEAGVTVVRGDGLAGEESYEVICTANDAVDVLDILVNHGLNAVPFGHRTWNDLTLEAGTPLFSTELDGYIPNVVGIPNVVSLEKGCFVGQEVVSKVANRGKPSRRLVGLCLADCPTAGDPVSAGGTTVGTVTRASTSPILDEPIAFGYVEYDVPTDTDLSVEIDSSAVPARIESLPFVSGSQRSARIPRYDDYDT